MNLLNINWYSVFYWVTVADGVKSFFDSFSNIFSWFAVISFIVFIALIASRALAIDTEHVETEEEEKTNPTIRSFDKPIKAVKSIFYTCLILSLITWAGYVFIPTKKDSMIIIAGGAVGNFIASDSSAKQIPYEVTLLLREKLKSEIAEIKSGDIKDTLLSKSKDELIELLRSKK